jgi:hypothetical protein
MVWTVLMWLRIGTSGASCERCNEPSGSIKCWKVLQWLHSWRFLKKGSAPWVSQSYFTTGGLPPISSSWRQAPWGMRPKIATGRYDTMIVYDFWFITCTVLLYNRIRTEGWEPYANLGPVCTLENFQWRGELRFAGAAILRGRCSTQIPRRGKHKSLLI